MKRFLLTLSFLILLIINIRPAFSADIIPLSSKSIQYYGIGVLNMPKSYTVYQFPSYDSQILQQVNYDGVKKSSIINKTDMRKISYVAFIPSENIAFLTVEHQSEGDWYSVYLNQKTGVLGWVHNDDENSFYTYKSLFYKFGKKYGLRIFNDLTEEEKVLKASEDLSSKTVSPITYPKFVSLKVIHGNWMLIGVNDINDKNAVGWFNWRRDDGTLNMFPNFSEPDIR